MHNYCYKGLSHTVCTVANWCAFVFVLLSTWPLEECARVFYCVLLTITTEKKISETELTARVLKKRSKTHEIKRTLFNWTKQDKTCKFLKKSSFSTYVQQKTRKTNYSTHLVSFGCGRLAEGKRHETESKRLSSFYQPPTSYWHKISWINCSFFCFVVVRSFKKRTSLKIYTFSPVSSYLKVFF